MELDKTAGGQLAPCAELGSSIESANPIGSHLRSPVPMIPPGLAVVRALRETRVTAESRKTRIASALNNLPVASAQLLHEYFDLTSAEVRLAQSLARPNANMTGLTYMAVELNGKRLELLREMTPSVRRVALLANPAYPGQDNERSSSEATAGRIGLDVRYVPARTSDELAAAFAKMAADKVQAVSVLADSFTVQNRDSIIAFGMKQHIPVVSSWPVFARSGALCSYGPRLSDSYQRLAYYVDRILRGTKPAELPIEQPQTIETIVNLKTADALGLVVPQAVLVRADQLLR